jgi:ribosomal protein S18
VRRKISVHSEGLSDKKIMAKKFHIGDQAYDHIDYKDSAFLRKFLNSQGKIYPPKRFGVDAQTQRTIKRAIKRARHMGLVPFVIK